MAEPESDSAQPIAEISHGPSALEGFLERNQKTLIGVGLVAALGIGASVVMKGVQEGTNRAAGEALLAAADIAAMEDVIKNHSETPAAGSATVLLSDLQWDQGQQSAAIETLQKAITENPNHPASFAAQARLGARLIDQGSLEKASEILQSLADNPKASYLAPYALTGLSEIAVANDDLGKAESLLEEARDSYPESPFGRTVSDHRRYVGFKMPVEIDPPAPAPDPEPAPGLDLSTPIQLDPNSGSSNSQTTTGNPLLDSLNSGSTPIPAEEPGAEDPAPIEGPSGASPETPADSPSDSPAPTDSE